VVTYEEPDEPAYAPDGVDLTMIRWFLDRTPAERLAYLEGWVASMAKLRNSIEANRG